MTEKILVCRYDGAYRKLEPIPPDDQVDAVRRFRRNGGIFGIITERDKFEIMAIISAFRGEFDFILCCSGGCLIAKGIGGQTLDSVGVEGNPPVQVYCRTLPSNVIRTLHGIFDGAGMTYMNADTSGFMGGPGMGMTYRGNYSPDADGVGIKLHFWYEGGQFFDYFVSADALQFVFPVNQANVCFGNHVIAEGAAAAAKAAFGDSIAVHMGKGEFRITAPGVSAIWGVGEYLRLAEMKDARVWAIGCLSEDVPLIEAFSGFAIVGSGADTGVGIAVRDVASAVEIIERG